MSHILTSPLVIAPNETSRCLDEHFAFRVDENLRILEWAPWAERLTGHPAEEAVGDCCYTVLDPRLPSGAPLCDEGCRPPRDTPDCRIHLLRRCYIRQAAGSRLAVWMSMAAEDPKRAAQPTMAVYLFPDTYFNGPGTAPVHLRGYLLGRFHLVAGDHEVDVHRWRRRPARQALKILLSNLDRPVHRETLIEALWPDAPPDRGWQRLKVAIHSLRGELRAAGLPDAVLQTREQAYLIDGTHAWTDVDLFERRVERGLHLLVQGKLKPAEQALRQSLHLYRGDYLEEDLFEESFGDERLRLRGLRERAGEAIQEIQRCRMRLAGTGGDNPQAS